jgi:polar amino acid transport system substrate-binding protein
VRALKGGRVDAIVIDLPTAFFLTAAQVPGSKIAGQFEAPGGDRWGLLLEKGSTLTPCVNQALAKLRSSGELERMQTQCWAWPSRSPGPPGCPRSRRSGCSARSSWTSCAACRRSSSCT